MSCFHVYVTCLDANSLKWIPLHHVGCYAQFGSNPIIILKDEVKNHIRTINLATEFIYFKENDVSFIVIASSSKYRFVVFNTDDAKQFEDTLHRLMHNPCPSILKSGHQFPQIFAQANAVPQINPLLSPLQRAPHAVHPQPPPIPPKSPPRPKPPPLPPKPSYLRGPTHNQNDVFNPVATLPARSQRFDSAFDVRPVFEPRVSNHGSDVRNQHITQIEEELLEGWNCEKCTLRNQSSFLNCKGCTTVRPGAHRQQPINQVPLQEPQPPPTTSNYQPPPTAFNNQPPPTAFNNQPPLTAFNNQPPPNLPADIIGGGWKCPFCTLVNDKEALNCQVCMATRQDVPNQNEEFNNNNNNDDINVIDNNIYERIDDLLDGELLGELERLQLAEFVKGDDSLILYPELLQCLLCKQYVADGMMVTNCLHCFCQACLKEHVKTSNHYQVKCPYNRLPACNSDISLKDIMKLVPHVEYQSFLRRTLHLVKESNEPVFYCRTPDCDGWCFIDGKDETFGCPLCGVFNCMNCYTNHFNQTCKEYQKMIKKFPEAWLNEGQIEDEVLVEMDANSAEYRNMEDFFHKDLQANCIVKKIERCQNKRLWKKYELQKKIMTQQNGAVNVNEKILFHGSKTTDPVHIWKGADGFDIRFSGKGMWGRGSYFADDSQYSLQYAYVVEGKTKQIIIAKVLTGFTVEMAADNTLKMPPIRETRDDGVQIRYDSVSGITKGTKVYIVYKFDVAYPNYIVTFDVP